MVEPGARLSGRYRIESVLGQGGMGCVYLARLEALGDKAVAIKEMTIQPTHGKSQEAAVAQFREEGNLLAHLEHPNLVQVNDFFEDGGCYYLVMAYIKGHTLLEVLTQRGSGLPVPQLLDISFQLCDVLEYLHGQDPPILFRDLKPANIMIDDGGRIRLVDFGIARRLQPEMVTSTFLQGVGSAGYAPLEQYHGAGSTDPRSDIYSLGATLFHLATNQLPVSPAELVSSGQELPSARAINPAVPSSLDQVIARMMAVRKEDRYANVAAVRRALEFVRASLVGNEQPTEQLGAPEGLAGAGPLAVPATPSSLRWAVPALAGLAVLSLLGVRAVGLAAGPSETEASRSALEVSQPVAPRSPALPEWPGPTRLEHLDPPPPVRLAAPVRPPSSPEPVQLAPGLPEVIHPTSGQASEPVRSELSASPTPEVGRPDRYPPPPFDGRPHGPSDGYPPPPPPPDGFRPGGRGDPRGPGGPGGPGGPPGSERPPGPGDSSGSAGTEGSTGSQRPTAPPGYP